MRNMGTKLFAAFAILSTALSAYGTQPVASAQQTSRSLIRENGKPSYSTFAVIPFIGAGGFLASSEFVGVKGVYNAVPNGFIPSLNTSFVVESAYKRVRLHRYYIFLEDETLSGNEFSFGVRMDFHLAKMVSVGAGTGADFLMIDKENELYGQKDELNLSVPISAAAHFSENWSVRGDFDLFRKSILVGPMFRM